MRTAELADHAEETPIGFDAWACPSRPSTRPKAAGHESRKRWVHSCPRAFGRVRRRFAPRVEPEALSASVSPWLNLIRV